MEMCVCVDDKKEKQQPENQHKYITKSLFCTWEFSV